MKSFTFKCQAILSPFIWIQGATRKIRQGGAHLDNKRWQPGSKFAYSDGSTDKGSWIRKDTGHVDSHLNDGNVDAANVLSFVLLFGVVSLDVFWSWLWSVCGVFSWFGGVVRKTPPFLALGSSCVFSWLDDPACALSRTSKYQIMTPVVETNNYQRTIQTHGLYR